MPNSSPKLTDAKHDLHSVTDTLAANPQPPSETSHDHPEDSASDETRSAVASSIAAADPSVSTGQVSAQKPPEHSEKLATRKAASLYVPTHVARGKRPLEVERLVQLAFSDDTCWERTSNMKVRDAAGRFGYRLRFVVRKQASSPRGKDTSRGNYKTREEAEEDALETRLAHESKASVKKVNVIREAIINDDYEPPTPPPLPAPPLPSDLKRPGRPPNAKSLSMTTSIQLRATKHHAWNERNPNVPGIYGRRARGGPSSNTSI